MLLKQVHLHKSSWNAKCKPYWTSTGPMQACPSSENSCNTNKNNHQNAPKAHLWKSHKLLKLQGMQNPFSEFGAWHFEKHCAIFKSNTTNVKLWNVKLGVLILTQRLILITVCRKVKHLFLTHFVFSDLHSPCVISESPGGRYTTANVWLNSYNIHPKPSDIRLVSATKVV